MLLALPRHPFGGEGSSCLGGGGKRIVKVCACVRRKETGKHENHEMKILFLSEKQHPNRRTSSKCNVKNIVLTIIKATMVLKRVRKK